MLFIRISIKNLITASLTKNLRGKECKSFEFHNCLQCIILYVTANGAQGESWTSKWSLAGFWLAGSPVLRQSRRKAALSFRGNIARKL